MRSTTRLSHTRSVVTTGPREERAPKGFVNAPGKTVTIDPRLQLANRGEGVARSARGVAPEGKAGRPLLAADPKNDAAARPDGLLENAVKFG